MTSEITITVYWRPGCLFCAALLHGLERVGLHLDEVDIWRDPEAAAFVRSVTGGAETVPTVRVAGYALINPSVREVLRVVATEAPDRLPYACRPTRRGLLTRATARLRCR